ncbi:MAG TPA: formate dehydrogenase accessory sulfurtransferase FdhD [Candidatus Limnocylindria bacterium]
MTTTPGHAARMSRVRISAIGADGVTERDDIVAGEEPLQVLAAGPGQDPVEVAVTMRTPGNEDELAVGFLVSEGLIRVADVVGVTYADPATTARPDDSVTVNLANPLDVGSVAERRTVATASCGICGKASIDDVVRRCDPLPDGPIVSAATILDLPDALRAAQETFEATGGLHAAGLFNADGSLIVLREDVGRHNALDKVIGERARAGALPLHGTILLLSGRVSFELVQKAAAAGIPILAAVGAPTDLAIATADGVGMTVIGFVRGERANVYTRPERVAM